MIFDTDVIIWAQRGNKSAAIQINKSDKKFISLYTYMELLQLAKTKKQQHVVKKSLNEIGFDVLPITQNIGHRAAVYIEEYSLAHGLRAGDAIIAATSTENELPLMTANKKHFKCINDLSLRVFKP